MLFSRKNIINSSANSTSLFDVCFSRIKKRYMIHLNKKSSLQKNTYKTLCVAHATKEEKEQQEQEKFLDQAISSL